MPIKIPNDLPAFQTLENENIFVIPDDRAAHQDIRALKIAIVNLMPDKIATETQLLRLLSNTPLHVDIDLIQMSSHMSKNTSLEHMLAFYKNFDEVCDNRYDGLIITGAPVEQMEYEDVDYWDELCRVFEWSKTNVFSTIHICWGAQAGLQLMGFYEYFNAERVQICGNMEFAYLASLDEKTRYERIDALFATKIPLFIVARGHELYPEMVEIAKKYGVPIARTQDSTTAFIAALIGYLNVELAPRITRHGVLIEVYGEGILIVGESGVGKSETAIELVKRGHRLVADDAVEIRKTSNRTLVGSSPDNIRHFLELRGIGIINTRRLFGMGAVKVSEKIDLIVELEPWDSTKIYDRMGVDNEYTTILGIKIPSLTIPIKPGRNLAVILEVAAMNNRQKKMGYNAAAELLQNLGLQMDKKDKVKNWDNF